MRQRSRWLITIAVMSAVSVLAFIPGILASASVPGTAHPVAAYRVTITAPGQLTTAAYRAASMRTAQETRFRAWHHQRHLAHLAHLARLRALAAAEAAARYAAAHPAPVVHYYAPVRSYQAPARSYQAPVTSVTYHGGSGYQACVIARESGGNSQVWNASGHYGLYQFSGSTWSAAGGNPADFGHASVAEQNRVFQQAYAKWGTQPWSPSDGC